MQNRPTLPRVAILATFVALWPVFSAQSAPVGKARHDKASEFLKLAQDNLSKSTNTMLADMGRGDVCLAQASLGDLAAAKKSAAAIDFLKVETQTAIVRIEARTSKANAIQYLHTFSFTRTSSLDDVATVAETQADIGDIDGAHQRASAMKPSWQQAKVFVAIARAEAKAGDLPTALKTFTSAKTALKANTDPYPWLRAVDIAAAQLEAGDAAGARQTANDITDPDERAAAMATLASIAAQKTDKAAARELLDISRKTLAENKTPDSGALISLARAYAATGEKETAKALLAQARAAADAIDPRRESAPETLASVSLAQRATGDTTAATDTLQAAMAALDKMTNTGNRCHALWTIAGAQANAGDSAGARQTLALALKAQMDPAETAMRAASVARSLARAADPTSDLDWIAALATPEEKGLAYAAAAAGLLEAQDAK